MDAYKSALRGNLWKLNLLAITTNALFILPVIVLFYQENGLSLRHIFLLQGAFALSAFFWEIPSGYFSDSFGRRKTLIIATVFGFLGYVTYLFSGSFIAFVVAEILLGAATSFVSGTDEALTYDILAELGEEKHYRKAIGRQTFCRFSAEAAASVLGGMLALIHFRLAFAVTVALYGVACLIATSLMEPERHTARETQHLKKLWDTCTHTLIRNAPLRSIIVLHMVISTMTMILFWLTQPFQMMAEVPIVLFGVLHGAIVLTGAFASSITHMVQRRIDDRLLLLLIAGAVVGSCLGLGYVTTSAGLIFFFIVRIAWGFLSPLTSDLVNRMANTDMRATTLSLRTFLFRIFFVTTSPFIGTLVDNAGLPDALFTVGLIGAGVLGFLFLMMRPVWSRIPT